MRWLALIMGFALALGPRPASSADIRDAYRRLARTINFELANETDDWGALVRPEHLESCKRAGFTAIRLPINWARHTAPAGPAHAIDPRHFARVDVIVKRCLALGLAAVLDNPKDRPLMADPAAHRSRFLAMCRQIAEHYRDWPPDVMLEPMAEPHDALNKVWSEYFADALRVIRRADPDRAVLVGPPGYNAPEYLKYLELPPDPALIVCVHIYVPTEFVFQGESFLPGKLPPAGKAWRGTREERRVVAAAFDTAARWGQSARRPVFVEEFGSTDRADLASRALWTAWCRRLAEQRGLSWGIWGFAPTFTIYDLSKQEWRRPLLRALIPGK